jgi:hypothetical protein
MSPFAEETPLGSFKKLARNLFFSFMGLSNVECDASVHGIKAFYRSRSDRSCAALPNMDRSCGEQFHAHHLFGETPMDEPEGNAHREYRGRTGGVLPELSRRRTVLTR